MREILFKGKKIDGSEWVEGFLVMVRDGDSGNMFPNIVKSHDVNTFDWDQVEPMTVSQFTGLTDVNGDRIFENSTVTAKVVLPGGELRLRFAIVYHEDGFAAIADISGRKTAPLRLTDLQDIEIIVEFSN